jgi:hypothetical protein
MENSTVIVKSFGKILPKEKMNIRSPYPHQISAMKNLDLINTNKQYSTLVVLPTGGGKTYTASVWLLKNAINKQKKILWIAHRKTLLDQAVESFQQYAYKDFIPNISSFQYRVISGDAEHDKTINIEKSDDLLVVSKDSIGRNLKNIDRWLEDEEEVFLIIDEAHHSTAKTYRKVIDYIKEKVPYVKLIGLTATPFRTNDNEKGLLSRIYKDGVELGDVVNNDIGIAYNISLKELISKNILSKPIFESYYTDESYGRSLGIKGLESIQNLDILPEDIQKEMAQSAARNQLIVKTYKENQKNYGQTIVFAVNIVHAIQLTTLFKKEGINAAYIVSNIKDIVTGVTVSSKDNEKNLEDYRSGKIKVLVNVNILTEGVDLPQTKTVFLARPTVSTILMTQMIGRALRGTKAGGTDLAYIVSFIDNWNEHIAWVNPDSLFIGENEFVDNVAERVQHELRLIAISKIEEFAAILDNSVDTSKLEQIDFIKRVPIGMYSFSYIDENGMESSYQIMIYDSTKKAYEEFINALPEVFSAFSCEDEYPSQSILEEMEAQCRDTFFLGDMIPNYEKKDVIRLLKYYAQYESAPKFYLFDDIDRDKLDLGKIAKYIYEEDMGISKKTEYINSLWDEAQDPILRNFFGKKLYFKSQLEMEIMKLTDEDLFLKEDNVEYGARPLEDLTLHKLGKINPDLEKKIRAEVFEKSKDKEGYYTCAVCTKKAKNRIYFQIDHIVPMNKGGKTKIENLQVLCRKCNGTKSDIEVI